MVENETKRARVKEDIERHGTGLVERDDVRVHNNNNNNNNNNNCIKNSNNNNNNNSNSNNLFTSVVHFLL